MYSEERRKEGEEKCSRNEETMYTILYLNLPGGLLARRATQAQEVRTAPSAASRSIPSNIQYCRKDCFQSQESLYYLWTKTEHTALLSSH